MKLGGQEMLVEYHGKVAKDEEEIGKKKEMIQKEMIQAAADQMIMKLEEKTLSKESIRSIFQELQQNLEMIEMKELIKMAEATSLVAEVAAKMKMDEAAAEMKMAEATSLVAEAAAEAFRDAGGFEAKKKAFRDAFRD